MCRSQVDASNFVPSLPRRVAAAIDAMIARNPPVKRCVDDYRKGAAAWYDAVIGSTVQVRIHISAKI